MFDQGNFIKLFVQNRVSLRRESQFEDDDVMAPSCGECVRESSQKKETEHKPETLTSPRLVFALKCESQQCEKAFITTNSKL